MSQIRLTPVERIQALQRFGYTEREAQFLGLAALQGGHFLRRQYSDFLQKGVGGSAALLIEKLVARRHARAVTFVNHTHAYHLSARPFYAALGQEDNRNRRMRQPLTVKAKVMGLDFVLAHRQQEYLTTEQEKLDYFLGTLQLDRSTLPVKRYASRGRVTDRYFIEKYPVFLSPSSEVASPPVVSFCFVDAAAGTVAAFRTFLEQYQHLFRALRQFQVIYVADTESLFSAAQAAFHRFSKAAAAAPADPQAARMAAHFEARDHYETQQWDFFDRAKLIRLREERREFSGEEYEALYEQWKATTKQAAAADSTARPTNPRLGRGSFSTYWVRQNYDLFGTLVAHR
jgi:hypothetical protein